MKPEDVFKDFYGFSKKVKKLADKYSPLVTVMCSETDKENIEKIGGLRFHKKIMEDGIKVQKKEGKKDNIYRDMFFRRCGIDPEKNKIDKEDIKEIQKELEEIEEQCKTIEILPRPKKTLSEISENMSIPLEELREYVKKAENDGVIKKTENSYQLTKKGMEVAYASFGRKRTWEFISSFKKP